MNRPQPVILAVVLSTFFVGFGGGVVFPILPNLESVLGISPFLVGLILSANRFTRILANAPAGSLIDRIGTRTPFIVGLFGEAGATAVYVVALGAAFPEAWFLGARVLWGLGSAMVFATAYTIAADVSTGRSRGTSMGVVRGGITLGFPTGLVLGGVVSDVYSISTAFIVAALFALLASVIATLVLFVDSYSISMWGYGPQGTSGLLMAVTVLSAAVFTFGGGKGSDLLESRTLILSGFLVVSFFGFLTLGLAETLPGVLLACLLIGAGQGGTSGPLMALLADFTPNERMGRAMGSNNVLGDLGGGLGPMVSIPLVHSIGYRPVYVACAIVPLIALVWLLGGVYRRTGELNPDTAIVGDD